MFLAALPLAYGPFVLSVKECERDADNKDARRAALEVPAVEGRDAADIRAMSCSLDADCAQKSAMRVDEVAEML